MRRVDATHSRIIIGRYDENEVTKVYFPVDFPEMQAHLLFQRFGDRAPYVINLEADSNEDTLIWTVTAADTAKPGKAKAEIYYTDDLGRRGKSQIYDVFVQESMTTETREPPDPYRNWYDEFIENLERSSEVIDRMFVLANESEENAESARESANAALAHSASASESAAQARNDADQAAEAKQISVSSMRETASYASMAMQSEQLAEQSALLAGGYLDDAVTKHEQLTELYQMMIVCAAETSDNAAEAKKSETAVKTYANQVANDAWATDLNTKESRSAASRAQMHESNARNLALEAQTWASRANTALMSAQTSEANAETYKSEAADSAAQANQYKTDTIEAARRAESDANRAEEAAEELINVFDTIKSMLHLTIDGKTINLKFGSETIGSVDIRDFDVTYTVADIQRGRLEARNEAQ